MSMPRLQMFMPSVYAPWALYPRPLVISCVRSSLFIHSDPVTLERLSVLSQLIILSILRLMDGVARCVEVEEWYI